MYLIKDIEGSSKRLFHRKIESSFFFHINPEILANLFNQHYKMYVPN